MDTTIIEVVLGLVLIYAVLAVLVMKVQELLAGSMLHYRAGTAHDLLLEATGRDETLKAALLANPLIFALFQGDKAEKRFGGNDIGPSAIPPELFARALLIELNAKVKGGQPGQHPSARRGSPSDFIAADAPAGESGAGGAWGSLRALLPGREGNWADFEAAIAAWFAQIGDRSEGWFKRRATKWTVVLSLLLAGLLNVDTAHIARTLASDPQLRVGLADLAESVDAQRQADAAGKDAAAAAPAVLAERPETQVSSRMSDAITQLNNAFSRDKSVALFRANLSGVKDHCKPVKDGRLSPRGLSDSDIWVQVLPILLARIETAQLQPGQAVVTYEEAFGCLAHVAAWVRTAVTASPDADVRKSMQDAAAALESAKSGLLRLIAQQSATLSLRRAFLAEPERFAECAADGVKSRAEFDACLRRELSFTLRLPLLHGGQNSRQQFCRAVDATPRTTTARVPGHLIAQPASAASAPAVQVLVVRDESGTTLTEELGRRWLGFSGPCGARFDGDARLGLPALQLAASNETGLGSWLAGIAVTALFISLGAPFWFDVLSKVVKVRAAGRLRDQAEDDRRARGTQPLPAPAGTGGVSTTATPAGGGGPGTGPFPDSRNAFEDKLVAADIVRLQQKSGVPTTGRLDGPTRTRIRELSATLGTPTEELTPMLFEAIVGRSATRAAPIETGSRVQRGATNERAQPLAKALMRLLAFESPPRIASTVTRFDDDLRALVVLYRYKKQAGIAVPDREVCKLALSNPRVLDEVDEALLDEILRSAQAPFAREAPAWLDWAIGELGQVEADSTRRADSNPRICDYLDLAQPGSGNGGDHTPWCGAFVSWVLLRHIETLPADAAGNAMRLPLQPPKSGPLRAANWAQWGSIDRGQGAGPAAAVAAASAGDVVLFKPDPARPDGSGHVAFFMAKEPGVVWVLGGNQTRGSRVSLARFPETEVVTVRGV